MWNSQAGENISKYTITVLVQMNVLPGIFYSWNKIYCRESYLTNNKREVPNDIISRWG